MFDPLSHDPRVISGIFFYLCSRVNSKQMLLNNCLSILINKKVQKLQFWTFWAPTPPGGVHELKDQFLHYLRSEPDRLRYHLWLWLLRFSRQGCLKNNNNNRVTGPKTIRCLQHLNNRATGAKTIRGFSNPLITIFLK